MSQTVYSIAKTTCILATVLIVICFMPIAHHVFADTQNEPHAQIQSWISDTTLEWIDGKITDGEFFVALKRMLAESDHKGAHIQNDFADSGDSTLPGYATKPARMWIEDRAIWWTEGRITDGQFLNAVRHLDELGHLNGNSTHTNIIMFNASGTESLESLLLTEQEIDAITRVTKWRIISTEHGFDKTDGVSDSVRVLSRDINRVYEPVFNRYKIPTMSMQITKLSNQTSVEEYWLGYANQTIQKTQEYAHMTGRTSDGIACIFNYSDDGAATTCMRDDIIVQVVVFDKYGEHYTYGAPDIDLDATEPTTSIMDRIIKKINTATSNGTVSAEPLRYVLQKKPAMHDTTHDPPGITVPANITATHTPVPNNNLPTTNMGKNHTHLQTNNGTQQGTQAADAENLTAYGISNLVCTRDDFGVITITGRYNNDREPKDNLNVAISFVDWEENEIGSTNLPLEEIKQFEVKRFLGHIKWDGNFAYCQAKHQ